jgi:hypothetical protein
VITTLNIFALPPHVKITIPLDGGFWLVDMRTGVRYRRVTMDDLGDKAGKVSWESGKGRRKHDDSDEREA